MLAIIVSSKSWGHNWQGRIIIHCDKLVSVTLINTGRTEHKFCCLQEIAFIAASDEFEIRGVHIADFVQQGP